LEGPGRGAERIADERERRRIRVEKRILMGFEFRLMNVWRMINE
jgi:hypothetical protein